MARRRGRPGEHLLTSDYTGVTIYASEAKTDYWGDIGEWNLKRNLQEIATPLNDPYPVQMYRGPSYEFTDACMFELQPAFIGKTNIPFPNSMAAQVLNLNPSIPNMSISCTFVVSQMTQYNKATLKTFFETGDVPNGSDYANFIDSCLNLVETGEQDMAGPLGTSELIASRVSAGNINVTGTFSTNTFSVAGIVSAAGLSVTGDLRAANGSVVVSAATIVNGVFQSVGIVSAAGTAQASAAPITFIMNNCQGATDGQATGFVIPANRTGLTQYVIYKGAVSANLWPPIGGTINTLSQNSPFPLAAGTSYTIMHIAVSAYGVK